MASVTLTNRELKNRATGIDIRVPQHEQVSGPFGGSVLYHVIVVTRLFYFKTPSKHKESDVVQFMIPQKYEVFEELCNRLTQKFPSVVFSPPPKKTFISSDAVITERRLYMEEVLQQIAHTPKLACSSLVLEFLGAKRGHNDINRLEVTQSVKDEDSSEQKNSKEEVVEDIDLFAETDKTDISQTEHDEEDREDLLSLAKVSSAGKSPLQTKDLSIFGTNDNEDGDDDINNLFVPAGADEKKFNIEIEDNSQLLNIQDDLDKLLTVQRKPPKPEKPVKPVAKPRLKPKPDLKPKPTPKPRFAEAGAAEDELFGTVSSTTKQERPVAKERKFPRGEQDLFAQARKQSFNRTSSLEEETLDDIFNSPSKPSFTITDDEDLFKQTSAISEPAVQDMSADDIASYIQQNMPDTDAKLDLF